MTQHSRHYQIGLLAGALLAATRFLLFQGHHGRFTSGSGSRQSVSTATHTAQAHTTAPKAHAEGTAGEATGHGSASSLGAFGHAIEKARGAATTSQHNTQELDKQIGSGVLRLGAGLLHTRFYTDHFCSRDPCEERRPSTTASAPATKAPSTSTSSAKGTVRAAVAVSQVTRSKRSSPTARPCWSSSGTRRTPTTRFEQRTRKASPQGADHCRPGQR